MSKTIKDLPVVSFSENEVMSGKLPTIMADLAQKHGPIFMRKVLQGPQAGLNLIFMVGPEANRFVLHTHRDAFSHDKGWTPIVGELLGKGLLNMDDPDHARHRKMWNPAFASACMALYVPLIQDIIRRRSANWVERGVVDVYQESREITFEAAAAALAGFEAGPAIDRLRELFYFLLHGFDASQTSWEQYFTNLMNAQRELNETLLGIIRQRRAMSPEQSPNDVLSMIVHAKDEQGQELSDQQVLDHVYILLIAGHETTTTLGAWVLHLLATKPQERALLEAELEAALTDPKGTPDFETLKSLKRLDYFVKEAGRLYPPVLNVPRGVVKDVEFNGYTIPAGSQIRLALAGTLRLPQVFANPDQFDPDRFAPPRDEEKRTPYSLVTFGGGPRVCIGINFATIEVKALVAYALQHFDFEAVPDQHIAHAGYFTALLPNGIKLKVSAKSS